MMMLELKSVTKPRMTTSNEPHNKSRISLCVVVLPLSEQLNKYISYTQAKGVRELLRRTSRLHLIAATKNEQ